MPQYQDREQDESLLARQSSPIQQWFETLAITLLFAGFGAWIRPGDPLYVEGSFPWPVLAPLLVGLRYGFFMALVSALLLLAVLGVLYRTGNASAESFPYVWSLGLLAVGLIAGEFRDYWGKRLQRLEAGNRYREIRLGEFTRNFYLLKVSHDRLEQQLAGSSNSLREALRRLYGEIAMTGHPGLDAETADLMLQLLVRYGQLQIAAIYAVTNNQLSSQPLATIGDFKAVRRDNPLLNHALKERKLVSIQTEFQQRLEDLDTDLLLAIPMIDARERILGICLVEAIPFFSFQTRTLRLLAILAGHMADMVLEQQETPAGLNRTWRHLRFQLARAAADAEQFGVPAALVGLTLSEATMAKTVVELMQRMRRGLDVIAEDIGKAVQRIVILMPLTDELGLAGYLQRLDEALKENLGESLSRSAISSLHIHDRDGATQWLDRFLSGEISHDQ